MKGSDSSFRNVGGVSRCHAVWQREGVKKKKRVGVRSAREHLCVWMDVEVREDLPRITFCQDASASKYVRQQGLKSWRKVPRGAAE